MNVNEFCGIDSFGRKPDGSEMSHEEKYTKLVEGVGLNVCIRLIPATKEKIIKALESDKYLNNIPLKKWDSMHELLKIEFRRIGITTSSISETVCTLKRASKMWVERDGE